MTLTDEQRHEFARDMLMATNELELVDKIARAVVSSLKAECGIVEDDPRLGYVTVQVPRVIWEES